MRKEGKKESKEVEIRRKLAQSGITKPEDFQEIISNLVGQRQRLEGDLHGLRQKVVALQEKQARKQKRGLRPQPKKVIKQRPNTSFNQREELTRKYEQLKQWQKRSKKAMKNSAVQAQYRAYLDKLFSLEQEIQLQLHKFNDEKVTHKRLRKAMRELQKQQQKNTQVQGGVERENHLLKKKIVTIKRMVDRQMNKEIDLQNTLIDMREKQREGLQRDRLARRDSRLGRSLQTRGGIRHQTEAVVRQDITISSDLDGSQKEDEVSVDFIPSQFLTKDEIYQVQGHLNRTEGRYRDELFRIERRVKHNYPNQALTLRRDGSKLTYNKELELSVDRVKNNLNVYSELNKHKVKILFQRLQREENRKSETTTNNFGYSSTSIAKGLIANDIKDSYYTKSRSARKLKNLVGDSRQKKEQKPIVKYPRTFSQGNCQTEVTEYQDQHPLRRDFTGTFGVFRNDDRNILMGEKNSTIRTLRIYYTDRGIASIQAVYSLNSTDQNCPQTMEGKLTLPNQFVESYCKVHTIDTNHEDFIRYFKLRFNLAQNRVTSIKIVTNRNVKGGFGDSKIKGQEYVNQVDHEVERDWVFDIDQDEFPVSIFVGHVQKGPYWYLSGFGVQINDL